MEALATTPAAVEEYVLRSLDPEADLEKLAVMWAASDDQWPGTFSRGVPITAERIREWLGHEQRLEALVWDTGDAIAGYCTLCDWLEEPNVTYIPLLNVAPAYQKLSLGRKFLTSYVERVIALGSVRLDLHTWSGNLKAVPLYKKCGFFWEPGTSVHMINFMPAILTMPATRPFFERHDWYRTLQRELTQAEDDERWEGMHVFTYRFAADGDSLTVWADREARRITAVETDTFFAAAIAPELEPARGLPATIRWRLRNKSTTPMHVSLIASGDQYLQLDHRATIVLAPGEERQLEAAVKLAVSAPQTRADGPAPAIRSLVVIDGEVLELGTGLRPSAAVKISTFPEHITIVPGVEQTIPLQFQSRVARDIQATVSISPQAGLWTDWTQQTVPLAASGSASLPVRLCAEHGGVFDLAVTLSFEHDGTLVTLPPESQTIFALAPGGLLGARVGDKLRIANETMGVMLEPEGGGLSLYERASGEWLCYHAGAVGPPFAPNEYRHLDFDLALDHTAGEIVATATAASRQNPGFVLRKRVAVNASGLLAVSFDLENLSSEARRFQLLNTVGSHRGNARLTLPLRDGIGRGWWEEFPGMPDGELRKASAYAEQWAAIELPTATVGLFWPETTDEVEFGWGLETLSRFYDCAPQSRVRTEPLRIQVGAGDWRSVRRTWLRTTGRPYDTSPVEARGLMSARLDPGAVIVSGDTGEATLLVEHRTARTFSGSASLVVPAGWQADATAFDLCEVSWQQPHRSPLRLTTTAAPGVEYGRLSVRSNDFDMDAVVPLVRLGDGRSVEVRPGRIADQDVLTIANGRIEIDVAPEFGGTVMALRADGINHLRSSFPTVGALGWMAPWHGGITSAVLAPGEWGLPGSLVRETFQAESLNVCDAWGITWYGVRQRAALTAPKLHGLIVEIDTLTTGGSPVMKHVLRVVNTTAVVQHLETAGLAVFIQPDGTHAHTTLHGLDRQIKPMERMAFIQSGTCGVAENAETGRSLALISTLPRVTLAGWGPEGGHFELLSHFDVPANGQIEVVAYLALAESVASAQRYAVLAEGSDRRG